MGVHVFVADSSDDVEGSLEALEALEAVEGSFRSCRRIAPEVFRIARHPSPPPSDHGQAQGTTFEPGGNARHQFQLLAGLAAHPGIGLVVVLDDVEGPVALRPSDRSG